MFIVPPPHTSGIYKITCTTTGKFYIGSSCSIRKRWQVHYRKLQNGSHDNPHLQSAWIKYGADAFDFEIIELVLSSFLIEREQYYLDKLKCYKNTIGFNMGKVAETPNAGRKVSAETREKMSAAQRGKSKPWLHTPEAKARAKERMRLRPLPSKETIERRTATKKRNDAIKGYSLSPESRQKIRDTWALRPKIAHHLIITPEGDEILAQLSSFCDEHNLDMRAMQRVSQGKCKHHKGYKVRRVD